MTSMIVSATIHIVSEDPTVWQKIKGWMKDKFGGKKNG